MFTHILPWLAESGEEVTRVGTALSVSQICMKFQVNNNSVFIARCEVRINFGFEWAVVDNGRQVMRCCKHTLTLPALCEASIDALPF